MAKINMLSVAIYELGRSDEKPMVIMKNCAITFNIIPDVKILKSNKIGPIANIEKEINSFNPLPLL